MNEGLWYVWCWCLMKSSYKERWKTITTGKGKTEVKILPGQFIFGRKTAAKELKMKESTVYDRMKKLEKCQNINIKTDTHYSIVTICNWNKYQPVENEEQQAIRHPSNTQATPKQHKQEGKEGKEVKIIKKPFGSFLNVFLSEEEHKKLKEKFNGKAEEKIEKLSVYVASMGKKYKSHYATILNWSLKDPKEKEEKW
jgi:hypothetical protein